MARSKKFTTWTWRHPHTHERVDIEVRCREERPVYGSVKTVFEASSKNPAYPVDDCDASPDALRERVFRELNAASHVDWEYVLKVEVSGDFSAGFQGINKFAEPGFEYVGIKGEFGIDVEPHQVGTRADGSKVHNRRDGAGCNVLPGDLGGGDWRCPGTETRRDAVIPDTPENRLALHRIVTHMHRLHQQLRTFLQQDRIAESLQRALQAPGMLGLPAPEPEPRDDGRDLEEPRQELRDAAAGDARPSARMPRARRRPPDR